jgi:predicted AAA+ superfamily ATPase
MLIARTAESRLRRYLQQDKICLLLGARQVGKTTLVKQVLSSAGTTFLNLDLPVDAARFRAAAHLPAAQALRHLRSPQVLVIDEAQRFPEVSRVVKGWYDAGIPTRLILLGSSSLHLLDQAAESLAGRNVKLELPPLLFREILAAQEWYLPEAGLEFAREHYGETLRALLLQNLVFGSYPEAVTTEERDLYLINLVSDYVLKDIAHSEQVKSPRAVLELLTFLAHQTGREISVNHLADRLGTSRITLDKYLDLLERSYLIFRLPPFSNGYRGEISRNCRVYFWDTGVRNALLKDFQLSVTRADAPYLWENWVIAEAAKANLLSGRRSQLYYWRTVDGAEVNLIIKKNGALRAVNTQWGYQPKKSERGFQSRYGLPVTVLSPDGRFWLED